VSQVYQVHDRVESMLDTYSKAMETLNEVGARERKLGGAGAFLTRMARVQEVLGYHELITQWESVVDAALRKQGLA
jgi:hypothetical protein